MYRIVCESYQNFIKDFIPNNTDDYRYRITKPLELLLDLDLYKNEKCNNTIKYKKLQDLVYKLKNNIDKYPNFKSLLWSLESRGIYGNNYEALSDEEFSELSKLINMFLKLSYWG